MKKKVIAASLSVLILAGCNSGSTSASGINTVSNGVSTKSDSSSTLVTPDGTWAGAFFTNWHQWRDSKVSSEGA